MLLLLPLLLLLLLLVVAQPRKRDRPRGPRCCCVSATLPRDGARDGATARSAASKKRAPSCQRCHCCVSGRACVCGGSAPPDPRTESAAAALRKRARARWAHSRAAAAALLGARVLFAPPRSQACSGSLRLPPSQSACMTFNLLGLRVWAACETPCLAGCKREEERGCSAQCGCGGGRLFELCVLAVLWLCVVLRCVCCIVLLSRLIE